VINPALSSPDIAMINKSLAKELHEYGIHEIRKTREMIDFRLRIPPELHAALQGSAADNFRSLNKEILLRLYKSIQGDHS
jgi:hypothetical protein